MIWQQAKGPLRRWSECDLHGKQQIWCGGIKGVWNLMAGLNTMNCNGCGMLMSMATISIGNTRRRAMHGNELSLTGNRLLPTLSRAGCFAVASILPAASHSFCPAVRPFLQHFSIFMLNRRPTTEIEAFRSASASGETVQGLVIVGSPFFQLTVTKVAICIFSCLGRCCCCHCPESERHSIEILLTSTRLGLPLTPLPHQEVPRYDQLVSCHRQWWGTARY